jgi:hypothetical protein
MQQPTMPPPPPGWGRSLTPAPHRESLETRPAWRQGRPGWALLHLLIGTAVWFVGLFALGIVLAAAGRTDTDMERIGDDNAGIIVLFLVASLVGWFLFAYSPGSDGRRWAIFGCVTGGVWLIMVAALLNATS